MKSGCGFAKELNSVCAFAAATPTVLAARADAVGGIWMAVLGSKNEEWIGMIKVLPVLDGAETIGVAVGKEILRGGLLSV